MGRRQNENVGPRKVSDLTLRTNDNKNFIRIQLFTELNLPIVEEDIKHDRIQILIDYFTDTRHNHNSYTFRFFFCELLNFINVVGQIYFMDFFLGGEFTTYGSDVLAMTEQPQEDRNDPMSAVFPKVIARNVFLPQ